MTISTTESRISYNGNGVTTVFSFPYRFLANGDLVVVEVSAAGVETVKTLTTHYTLTGAGDDAGGSVTMLVAPASGTRLVIYRDTGITQETDYISGDPFPAETHERALDRLTMIAQEIGSDAARAIKVPVGDSSSLTTTLPAAADRLDKFIVFDATSGGTELSTVTQTQVASAVAAAYAAGSTADAVTFLQEGTGAVSRSVQSKNREIASRDDFDTDANFNTAKAGKLSHDSDNKFRATTFIAGTEELSSPEVDDAFVVGRTVSGTTDIHGFADRTIISSVSDAGTYGAFDATTEYTASGSIDHLYAFQGRGRFSGLGTLANYASFYHQPTIDGTVTDLHAVRVYNAGGSGTITNHHGVHIRPLTRGMNNFAVFSWGSTPSIHVGQWTFGVSTLDTTSAVAVETSGMTGITQSGVRSRAIGNSAALTSFSAFTGQTILAAGSYTTVEGNGLRVVDASLGAGVTLTNNVGVNVDDFSAGTNQIAYRSKMTAGATKWGLYFTGDAQNYLEGNLGIGVFLPSARIEVDAGTTTVAPLKLTAGVNLTTPVNGTFEFDGTNLYFTVGGVRRTVTLV